MKRDTLNVKFKGNRIGKRALERLGNNDSLWHVYDII